MKQECVNPEDQLVFYFVWCLGNVTIPHHFLYDGEFVHFSLKYVKFYFMLFLR